MHYETRGHVVAVNFLITMKPLFPIVVAILVLAANAELPKSEEPALEAEASSPQARTERCTACSGTQSLKSPKDFLAALKNSPNAEVHTQESFEGCSSEKGCAGLKVKDGKVVEKFGNLQAFQAAVNADTGNEFQFQAAGNSVFEGGAPNGGPFWWMNQNSPFKAGAAGGGGSFEKFSKSSSSFTSSSNTGAGGVDLGANPFLNGDFSKLAGGAGFTGAGAGSGSNFASQTFESSSAKEVDISGNPFLNGAVSGSGAGFGGQSGFASGSQSAFGASSQSGFGAQGGQSGFGAQAGQSGFGAQGNVGQSGFGSQGSQSGFNSFNANKFSSGSGYTGSSPAPFAPSAGANVNLIQNTQKSEYDFEQQQQTQQNIDEVFQSTGNVNAHDNSGGDLQQTCAGQGYVCVHKSQCNNGVVNTNGGGLLQANTQKQYCNTRTEICCRIETASLAGSNLQGSLGVGSGTFQSSSSNQGQGLFSQSGQGSQNTFGSSGFGSQSTNTAFNANANRGTQFGAGSGFSTNKFGSSASGFGSTVAPNRFGVNAAGVNEVFKSTSQSNFVETDSFSAGSENTGVFRPGAVGTVLKPGVPYLPPLDTSTSGSNVVSTAYTPTFVSTTRPFTTPRPVTTPRPYTTPKPTYLPPLSTKAPEYLPPIDGITGSDSFQNPHYVDGQLILDETLPGRRPNTRPPPPQNVDVPAGCAAALKCTPIEYCTAEGVISNTTVALTRDQEAYRVPLTDCKDLESGRIGKCCRDPYYTDPWPTNQLGKWVPGVFGGNDGKYVPDSRGSSNNQPGVSVRPPVTGSVYLNNFRNPEPTQGPNQVTPGYPSPTPTPAFVQKTQYGQGSYSQGGRGTYSKGGQGQVTIQGQGQIGIAGQGSGGQFAQGSSLSQTQQGFGQTQTSGGGQAVIQGQGAYGQGTQVTQGQGFGITQGGGQVIRQGSGVGVSQGQGFGVVQGGGQTVTQGGGQTVTQGFGTGIRQGQGSGVIQGQGSAVIQGQGFGVSQGQGVGVSQGQGFGVTQGQGQGVIRGQGFAVTGGQGQYTTQGQGTGIRQGSGFGVQQGGGFGIQQGGGFGIQQGGGFGIQQGGGQAVFQGQGQKLIQGQGEAITQGFGTGIRQGQGFSVSQGGEYEFGESVQRVYLPRYTGSGECGILNPQKPFGNRKDLEVDFAEIPWQAMVLLQTNKSLLCGGVITRPDVVITSASCVEGLKAQNVLIKGGEWKLGIDEEPLPFQIVQVKTILRHPGYKAGTYINDVAILVLTENLRLAKNIWPICLPSSTDTLDAFYNGAGECIVTGWGKSVLQAHLLGSIMHSLNVSLLNPGDCQSKITQDYPHLLEHYEQDSCVCGQPTNPANNVCKVDIGSALACTTGDGHYVLRGIYSWDSGCQTGNQLASFFKFDLEWYEWAIGLIESVRFSQYTVTKVTKNKIISQGSGIKGTFGSGIKGSYGVGVKGSSGGGVKGSVSSGATAIAGSGVGVIKGFGVQGQSGQYQFGSGSTGSSGSGAAAITGSGALGIKGFGAEGQFGTGSTKFTESGEFGTEIKGPIQNTFSATYTEKKFFQTEPKIVTYTTKPEIVTFTTKPEYFTYTTKPKYVTYTTKPEIITYTTKPEIITYTTKPEIVTYTTKPEIITYTTKPKIVTFTTKPQIIRYDYQTSGSQTNQQVVAPSVSFNPSFSEVVGAKHSHDGNCKCLEGKK
ncbi:hypothetical protein PYW08_011056 [Mythimna loreyi]|uniref:Uncharacterized protein n=1 Tax=Mythimna loreyi TaxID=667449 RepID=A0ACC2Q502_9NEOP|nr:hypothetical protein PYW08_011056 [Mythimna loreyi]